VPLHLCSGLRARYPALEASARLRLGQAPHGSGAAVDALRELETAVSAAVLAWSLAASLDAHWAIVRIAARSALDPLSLALTPRHGCVHPC